MYVSYSRDLLIFWQKQGLGPTLIFTLIYYFDSHINCMLMSPLQDREDTSSSSHYHTGMQGQAQKTWRSFNVISNVEVYEKNSQDTPASNLNSWLNMEKDLECVTVWVFSHQGISSKLLWNRGAQLIPWLRWNNLGSVRKNAAEEVTQTPRLRYLL